MKTEWEVVTSELMFEAKPWLQVVKQTVKLPDGKMVNDFYQIMQPDYVEIVALNDKNQVQGMWHYKHGVKKEHLGLPAGYLEKDEEPLEAAKRELLEECKLVSHEWEKLGEFVMEGNRGPAKGYFYLARNCKSSILNLASDDLEAARMVWLSVDEWVDYVKQGKVAVIGAATAILLANQVLKKRGSV